MPKVIKHNVKSWVSLVSVIVILAGVTSPIWLIPLLSGSISHQTFDVSEEIEKSFSDIFLKDSDSNSGITILLLSFYDEPSETQAGQFFDIAILNHTDENISFSNVAYGLRIFTPNKTSNKWREIKSIYSFGSDETILSRKTEGYSPKLNNSYTMFYSEFNDDIPEELRICVFGIGQITLKNYAACMDILRK